MKDSFVRPGTLKPRALVFGFAVVAAAGPTGCGQAESRHESSAAPLLGRDTFLYLHCNATGFTPDDRTRFVETSPGSGSFTLAYTVTQDWLVTGNDHCRILETDALNGWGTRQTAYTFRTGSSLLVVPDGRPLTGADSSNFQIKYPFKGEFTATIN